MCGTARSRPRAAGRHFPQPADLRRVLRAGARGSACRPSGGSGRCGTPGLRRQGPRKLHAELRRHRLDAHISRARVDDDHPGPRPVLRRHGAQEERRRHGDDELCHHLSDHDSLGGLHLQLGVPFGLAFHRRARSSVPAEHPERYLEGHRQSQSARADHSGNGLHLLPADLRHHHPGADRRVRSRSA